MNGITWFLFGLLAGIVGAWLLRKYVFKQQGIVPSTSPHEVEQILEEIQEEAHKADTPELWAMYQELLKKHGGEK